MPQTEIKPDWTLGTITLVSGISNFTTAGSFLTTSAVIEGDTIITRTGLTLVIKSITNDNAGILMEPCPAGAAGANQPLRIRYQSDGSRYTAASENLIRLMSGGNLYAFAGLVGSNNKVPYFTGGGTMALGDFAPSGNYVVTVNGEIGPDVILDAAKVGAIPASRASEISANTLDRHTHGNKSILDSITSAFTTTLKTKLDGVAAGATKNQTDAYLLARGNHTGAQVISTVTGLQTALDGKQPIGDYAGSNQAYNWIINPDFTINQRNGIKKPANGTYGFDRWKGHASGIEQVIESLPAGEYTLSWEGVGNGSLDGGALAASPITKTLVAGNKSVIVPQTATWVQVVSGKSTAKANQRTIGLELSLCQRYFYRGMPVRNFNLAAPQGAVVSWALSLPTSMRVIPVMTKEFAGVSYWNTANVDADIASTDGFRIMATSIGAENGGGVDFSTSNYVSLNAEL